MSTQRETNARRGRASSGADGDPERRVHRGLVVAGLAIVVAAAVVGGIFAARGNGPGAPVAAPRASSNALSLSGTDPVSGRRVDLAAFRGKPIVLNVWASWCEGCKAEAADLARFARAHPEVQVVGVDTQDTSAGAMAFYRRWNWQHPSIADPHGEIAASLAIQGLPTTFFLNGRHEVVSQIVGATDQAGFVRGLRAATHRSA